MCWCREEADETLAIVTARKNSAASRGEKWEEVKEIIGI